mgnify:CR=1 FL=1
MQPEQPAPAHSWHCTSISADGSVSHELIGASSFPRHWVYDHEGNLAAKSGVIDFGDGQVPIDKFLAVLRVADGKPPTVLASCGDYPNRHDVDLRRAQWCPTTPR